MLRAILPWFEDPLDFVPSLQQMGQESRMLDMWADDERSSRVFTSSAVPRSAQCGCPGLTLSAPCSSR
jgi:hypothetical protein